MRAASILLLKGRREKEEEEEEEEADRSMSGTEEKSGRRNSNPTSLSHSKMARGLLACMHAGNWKEKDFLYPTPPPSLSSRL